MKIKLLAVGKKDEAWIKDGVRRFSERLRAPFSYELVLVPHSSKSGLQARQNESKQLLKTLKPTNFVVLLDERGSQLKSADFSELILKNSKQEIVIIIGGAFGVDDELRRRADFVWSLSNLVFPHQLVRLIIAEQLYRAQEIYRGSGYHHE